MENELTEVSIKSPHCPGFRYTGELRIPKIDEWYYHNGPVKCTSKAKNVWLIMEKVQYRAKEGYKYWFISRFFAQGEVNVHIEEGRSDDDILHSMGNYFETEKLARDALRAIQNIFEQNKQR
jgi:hypothetical protein